MRRRSLKTQQRTFFDVENLDLGQASACSGERVLTSSPRKRWPLSKRKTLEVKGLSTELFSTAKPATKTFTESLILAQDERWRRA
jgi:hypothetical protein